jgi:two-component system phosphate regulon sensor histidine kinase PhoR
MKLTARILWIVTGLSIAALAGLVVLQYFLLRNAYDFRQQAFERNVKAAMTAIAQKLETTEAMGNVFQVALNVSAPDRKVKVMRLKTDSLQWEAGHDSIKLLMTTLPFIERTPVRIEKNNIFYSVPSPQKVMLQVFDVSGKKDTVLVNDFKQPGEYSVACDIPDFTNKEFVIKYWADSNSYTMRAVGGDVHGMILNSSIKKHRERIVENVVDNLSIIEREPIERRIAPAVLDSVVEQTLHSSGIDLPYVYGVFSEKTDSLRLLRPSGYESELRSSGFRNPLFPNDLIFSQNQLILFFPDQAMYLLKQVGPFLVLSIFFTGIIVICFAYTIRTIIKQKEFGVRLMDFVNNMTHEFKTPISTIAVAVETITRPEIIGQQEKVLRYTGIIQDENSRMKRQADKILQMAVLEEGDYDLKLIETDVHEIIERAVKSVALQVEAKHGAIQCLLDAPRSVIKADAVHFENIIYNVLDNANKYTPERPAIGIVTSNNNGSITIEIADNGIGISESDAARVFERYFRVHTGNVHNVKGFGLGLSYVKLMVEAHGGTVSLRSEVGKGTTVRITCPLSAEQELSNG